MKKAALVIALVLITMAFSGCTSDDDDGNGEDDLSIKLEATDGIDPRIDNDDNVWWDLPIYVTKISPKDTEVLWMDVEVKITVGPEHKDPTYSEGDVLVEPNGLTGTGHVSIGTDIEAGYSSDEGEESTLDVGDIITFHILDLSYEGTIIDLLVKGDKVGNYAVPTDFPPLPTTVNFASPSLSAAERDSVPVYDAILNINKITPKDATVLWSGLTLSIVDSLGTDLVNGSQLTSDTGEYHNYVEVWYVETMSGDTKMSAGDALKITGMSKDYEEATVSLFYDDKLVGRVTLASDFG